MKSVFEIAPTEEDATGRGSVEGLEGLLRSDRVGVEERVFVGDLFEDGLGGNAIDTIDGDEVLSAIGDALETIHPVDGGGDELALGITFDTVVPGGPAASGSGHDGCIGVDGSEVRLVGECGEQLCFQGERGVENAQRLVGVASADGVIEVELSAILERNRDPLGSASDAYDLLVESDPVTDAGGESVDVLL